MRVVDIRPGSAQRIVVLVSGDVFLAVVDVSFTVGTLLRVGIFVKESVQKELYNAQLYYDP